MTEQGKKPNLVLDDSLNDSIQIIDTESDMATPKMKRENPDDVIIRLNLKAKQRLSMNKEELEKEVYPLTMANKLQESVLKETSVIDKLKEEVKELQFKAEQSIDIIVYEQLNQKNENLKKEIEELEQQLFKHEVDLKHLRLTNNKLNFEEMKHRKTIDFLRQNLKGNETIIKGLKKDIKDFEEREKVVEEYAIKKSETSDELLKCFIDLCRKNKVNNDEINGLLNQFNKAHLIADMEETERKTDLIQKYTNLTDYDNLFNDSVDDFKFNSTEREAQYSKNSVDKEQQKKIEIPWVRASYEKKKAPLRQDFFTQIQEDMKTESDNMEDAIAYLKDEPTVEDNEHSVNKESLMSLLNYLESFFKSESNVTTFILNRSDKRELATCFQKSDSMSINKAIKLIIDVLLLHIDYLEKKITSLTTKNSHLNLKAGDMRKEINYLLDLKKDVIKRKNSSMQNKRVRKVNGLKTKKKEQVVRTKRTENKKGVTPVTVKKKRRDIRYKVPIEPEDFVSHISRESQNRGPNIWNKVTDLFS